MIRCSKENIVFYNDSLRPLLSLVDQDFYTVRSDFYSQCLEYRKCLRFIDKYMINHFNTYSDNSYKLFC